MTSKSLAEISFVNLISTICPKHSPTGRRARNYNKIVREPNQHLYCTSGTVLKTKRSAYR